MIDGISNRPLYFHQKGHYWLATKTIGLATRFGTVQPANNGSMMLILDGMLACISHGWNITCFNGYINYKWPFSIVMLVYQRVVDDCFGGCTTRSMDIYGGDGQLAELVRPTMTNRYQSYPSRFMRCSPVEVVNLGWFITDVYCTMILFVQQL